MTFAQLIGSRERANVVGRSERAHSTTPTPDGARSPLCAVGLVALYPLRYYAYLTGRNRG